MFKIMYPDLILCNSEKFSNTLKELLLIEALKYMAFYRIINSNLYNGYYKVNQYISQNYITIERTDFKKALLINK